MQNELALAQAVYDKEQAVYADLRDRETDLRDAIRQIQPRRDEYRKLVDIDRADVNDRSKRIASTELRMVEFDRQNVALESTFKVLAARLQEARIATAEQPASIRIVEVAVEPQAPLPSGQRFRLPIAALLGLFLGIMLALFVHYLQNPQPVLEKSAA